MTKSTIPSKNQCRIFNDTAKNRIFFKRNHKNGWSNLKHSTTVNYPLPHGWFERDLPISPYLRRERCISSVKCWDERFSPICEKYHVLSLNIEISSFDNCFKQLGIHVFQRWKSLKNPELLGGNQITITMTLMFDS